MKKRSIFYALLLVVVVACGAVLLCQNQNDKPYTIKNGMIHFEAPERAPGQTSMLGFAAEPIQTLRVGFIGLGMRGPSAVKRFSLIDGVEIKALCDLYPENVEKCQKILADRGVAAADEYSGEEGWKQLCEREDIDLVYIVTPWEWHVPMAVYAMEQGKHAAVEVPAAMTVEDCWLLVDIRLRAVSIAASVSCSPLIICAISLMRSSVSSGRM